MELHALGSGVRGHEAEVNHLLRTVDARLGRDLNLERQVEKLGSGGVGLDPAIINIKY